MCIHNVCTVTLYNYIYYVYVHICTGHQRYVSCHSSVPTCPLKTWLSGRFSSSNSPPLSLSSLNAFPRSALCQFKQIKIIFAQIVINVIVTRELITVVVRIFPTVQNNLTPSLEMDKFCALDTFPHSGSGQARQIKAVCGLSKHSSGPVTLARGNWRADHVTGVDFKGRTAAAAGRKERSVYACPSLAVLRNEGKDSLNRCSGFQGWKS